MNAVQSKATGGTGAEDREIVMSRVFDAPRELVWKVWTDPRQIGLWWGPRGFSTTTQSMEVKPGGVWRYCMHGPDGQDYENKITYQEVVAPERLVYKHGGEKEFEPVNFHVTVTFEKHGPGGKQTKLTMRSVFPTPQAKQFVVDTYGALEGGRQTLDRLGEHLAAASSGGVSAEAPKEFVLSRVFDAPRELVWKAWTERERLMKWFGPKGTTMPRATMDFRPGGVFHYAMQGPDGKVMWGKWTFREIVRPEKLVVMVSFSDEQGGIARHPMAADWPMETISTTTFEEHAGKGRGTLLTVRWAPHNATAAERAMFDQSHDGMSQGWGGTMEQLAAYLAAERA